MTHIVPRFALAGGLLLIAVGAGCGSSSKSGTAATTVVPSAPPTSTSVAPKPDVAAQLLTLADLPAGWSVDNSPSSGGGSIKGCDTQRFDIKSEEVARAEASFQKGTSGLPSLDQIIAAFGTVDVAVSSYAKGTEGLDACKNFSITDSGQTYTGTGGQLSLGATYGDQSKAYQFIVNIQGFNVGIVEVAVLKGSQITGLGYADLGSPDIATLNSLLAKAVSKMP